MDPILYEQEKVSLLDQRLLPTQTIYVECKDWRCVAAGIKDMVVRGAPAIGAAAAFGMALAAGEYKNKAESDFFTSLQEAADGLKATRPTAVNLAWAVDRMLNVARTQAGNSTHAIADILSTEIGRASWRGRV